MVVESRATPVIEQEIGLLADRYAFDDDGTVVDFLRRHPGVVTTLLQASDVIPRYFGPSPVVLELVRDPKARDDVELYARIQTDLAVDAALERLRRFDEDWWLDASPDAECALTITIGYV